MKQDNAISVAAVQDLEPGDLFAYETLGRLCSGIVKSVTYAVYQLDETTRSYMEGKHNLDIPEDQYAPLGGANQHFVLYKPVPWFGWEALDYEHIYIDSGAMVAVFGYDRSRAKSFIDTPECGE